MTARLADQDARDRIQNALHETQVVEAGSVAAVEQAAQMHPNADLILLDLYMPDARGFSALAHLRAIFPQTIFVGMEPAVKPAALQTR